MKEVKFISKEIAKEISNSTITNYKQIEDVVNRTLSLFDWSEVRDCNNKQAKLILSKERMKAKIIMLESKNKHLREFITSKGFDLDKVESDIRSNMELDGLYSTEDKLIK